MSIEVATTRQSLADNYKTLGTWISLHTADPTTTGGSEASGGSYARMQTTWTSSTGGVVNGSQVAITVPAGTYGWAGIWSASSAGTYVDRVALTSSVTLTGSGGQILVTPSITVS